METILADFASLVLNNAELDNVAEISNEVADVAGQIIRKYYSSCVRFGFREKNSDGPVTYDDIEAEEAAFPSHSIYGEETNLAQSLYALLPDQFIWVLDPIDGT